MSTDTEDINVNVLVAAKDEYTTNLYGQLSPLILEGLQSIYEDAKIEITKQNNNIGLLKQFQIFLKSIPKWNSTILKQETHRIKRECPYLMDLVTAVFVSNVKILASVRLSSTNKNIQVKIPTPDVFVHSVYIECAKSFFYDPYLFDDRDGNICLTQKKLKQALEIIQLNIVQIIRKMLPLDKILQEYLHDTFKPSKSEKYPQNTETEELHESDDDEDDYEEDDDEDNEEDDVHRQFGDQEIAQHPVKNISFSGPFGTKRRSQPLIPIGNDLPQTQTQPLPTPPTPPIPQVPQIPQQEDHQNEEMESSQGSDIDDNEGSDLDEETPQNTEDNTPPSERKYSFFD